MLSYKRLAYQPWYALAEFVDNSTQAYFNNEEKLDRAYAESETRLTVDIATGSDEDGAYIRIRDNSIGMNELELRNAVVIGRKPVNTTGRSKYGLGLKTGACWFGDLWTVTTKKLGSSMTHQITVDVARVAKGELDLHHTETPAESEDHFTIVEIRKLHREITGRTAGKIKQYLSSIYRVDIREGTLDLRWKGQSLRWDVDRDERYLLRADGKRAKKRFKFKIGRKKVHGWAGVLAKGSRRDAGFSVIQANRVIVGWPKTYRPETLFGRQEGGSNDLVNQRLVGEIFLKGFEVSHTKDQILFDGDDQDLLEDKLRRELSSLRQLALSHRQDVDERVRPATEAQRDAAINRLQAEVRSPRFRDFLTTYEVPRLSLIRKSNRILRDGVVSRLDPDMTAKINALVVSLYMVHDMSPNDPYVLIESTESKTSVIVIINLNHPDWSELTEDQSILNFIRHCTYDGVSEWKAFLSTGSLEPDTIKLIKDNLLRIPMEIQNN
jgi:hypothetical protein